MRPRVITLGPNVTIQKVLSFNEAVSENEDFSMASGRREKRQAKKAAKKEARTQKKLKRISDREQIKMARQAKKTNVASARQDRRTGKAVARQTRKTTKKGMRLERRAMGQDPILDDEENLQDQNGVLDQGPLDENTDYSQEEGYSEEEGYSQDGEEGTGDEYYPTEEEEQYYGDETEEDYPEEYDEDVYNFDGIMANEDPANEFGDTMPVKVPSNIQSIADKLEWNNEKVVRLDAKLNDITISDPDANVDEITTLKIEHQDRANFLTKLLEGFVNFDGEFRSSGDGLQYFASGNKLKTGQKQKRKRQVAKAVQNAREKRECITIIKSNLNPIIEKNKVTIPASSNMDGSALNDAFGETQTGLHGIDLRDDFDAPNGLEIQLGADGSKTSKNITPIVVGVGLSLLAIWAINKYKILK